MTGEYHRKLRADEGDFIAQQIEASKDQGLFRAEEPQDWKDTDIHQWFCAHCREVLQDTFNNYQEHTRRCDGPYAREG